MTKITLAAIAVLAATVTAFADDHHHGSSDHYGWDGWQQPVVKSSTSTASIQKPVQKPATLVTDRHLFKH